MRVEELLKSLRDGRFDETLRAVYGAQPRRQVDRRVESVAEGFLARFDPRAERDAALFSTPGRTELGGNHTDHQGGCVLAGSVDLDMLACVARREDTRIRVFSEGHAPVELDARDTEMRADERGSSRALVRGVIARFAAFGFDAGGFDAYVQTQVPPGSGLSSSAAFEVLIGRIVNDLSCAGALDATQLAQIGQYAENVYYGKPCGLMDQMTCSLGGVVGIDFADPKAPAVRRCTADFERAGLALVIIDSGADHADLDDAYAAVPDECRAVAARFGKGRLRDVDEAAFRAARGDILAACGERPTLRAEHFFAETKRAAAEYEALERGDFAAYLALVRASGKSSETKLQNVSVDRPDGDRLLRVIRAARELAGPAGAARVHGGGFAGTAQAYVPQNRLDAFTAGMERAFGAGCCHIVRIRGVGSLRLIG